MNRQILDPLRKKMVALTPEESVRQSVIRWLARECSVPMGLMCSEYHFRYNGLNYRSDIVVFDRKMVPVMMVECKAPSVRITQDVIDQGVRYNRVLNVRFMMFTNGKTSYICRLNDEGSGYEFVDKAPDYSEMTAEKGK